VLLSTLNRKLSRELWRMKGQIATIALVLASGIMSYIMLRGTYDCLVMARDAYYDRYRFAHVFATLERAPEALVSRLERIPGVGSLATRISKDVTVPIEGMLPPAHARLLSLPSSGEPATNALYLTRGRLPERGRTDEVVVLASFAEANGLEPGHHLPVVLGNKLRELRIVGIALSPEFIYAIRPGAMADDPHHYTVLWMERSVLGAAFDLEGAFNEVSLRLQPGASEGSVLDALDRLLVPYGGNGAYGRSEAVSHRILSGELEQLASLATMIPLVFLGVAAFLIRLVLGRLITLQRGEIAVLKAVGYDNREVGLHYLGLVAVVLLPGSALGVVGGRYLGNVVLQLYAAIFRLPALKFELTLAVVAWSVLVSVVGAAGGALLAVRGAVVLPPAEAMRPPAPARYRQTLIERLGLSRLVGPSGMMVLREALRRPLRTFMSALGIGGAISLLVLGRFGWDSMSSYFGGTFRREQRQDLTVTFVAPVQPRVVGQMARMPGVIDAEGLRGVPVRARHEHRSRDTLLIGIPDGDSLRQLVELGGKRVVPVPERGLLVTRKLADILGLTRGDELELQLREGERALVHAPVAGFVDESAGLQIYCRPQLLAELAGDLGAISSVLLRVDPAQSNLVKQRLRRSRFVIDVSDVQAEMERVLDMNASAFRVWTLVSSLLASSVIFGVVYNNARIGLTARSRDLGSLRVLGFSRREISLVLIGGLALEVALAIPIGLLLGWAWAEQFARGFDQETFRLTVVIAPSTYLMSASIALVAAAASAFWVRRDLDRLDLLAVLKSRE
jgi:putative ABC transport system permease protein